MTWWQAIILGLVQGATEFLPVSSSGHLILVRYWTGLSGDYLLFDSLLHLATLFAVVIVLRRDIISLWKPPFQTVGWIALATIPAVITGFLLKPVLETYFDTPKFLWIFFFATAILLSVTELLSKRNAKAAEQKGGENVKPLWEMSGKVAMSMGLMQAVAVLPGLSRSGSTIFGGVVAKGDRESVAKFSFLLSIPIILGAVVLELYSMTKPLEPGAIASPSVSVWAYLLGSVTAFAVGLFAIKIMLKVIQKANYKWFSFYLGVIGIVTLVCYFILGL